MTTTLLVRDVSEADAEALRRLAFDLRVPVATLLRMALSDLVVRAEEDSELFRRHVSETLSVHNRRGGVRRSVKHHKA
jgi:hypothetical protein